jgi:hypothetical protein
VVAPGGCRPTASPGAYERDEAELRAYLQAASTEEGVAALLDRVRSREGLSVGAVS